MKKLLIAAIALAGMSTPVLALDVYQSLQKEIREQLRTAPVDDVLAGPTIRLGDGGIRVLQLTRKLDSLGYSVKIRAVFTEDTLGAVLAFQSDRQLVADGLVGRRTIRELNFDRDEKLAALRYSLAHWQKRELDNRSIVVNIPAYELVVVEGKQEVMRSKTIVGRRAKKTPIFTDTVFSIKYNPEWNVPPGIFKSYMAKINNGNEQYLIDHGVEVVRNEAGEVTRMWQPAGADSALGLMKFEMRNDMNIYMHDTNERYLFNRSARAHSSGCIRVQEFKQLAAWLRSESEHRIQSRIDTTKTHWTGVNETEVHVVYMTAWPNANGVIEYHKDIYGYQT